MTIQSATATLTSNFESIAYTGFIPWQNGEYDTVSNSIRPLTTGTWAALAGTSWGEFSTYTQSPQTIRWTAPVLDLGAPQYFTLSITCEFQGSITYLIHVSETGQFGGEEKEYYIKEGDLNVPGFYGQFAYVTAILVGTELIRLTVEANSNVVSYRIVDINTATLGGTNTARPIPLPTTVSLIKDIVIQPKAAVSYPVNLYVSDTATSVVVIPVVTSKSPTAPTFALYGIDNDPRDSIVDITVTALPRQVFLAGNLVVLE